VDRAHKRGEYLRGLSLAGRHSGQGTQKGGIFGRSQSRGAGGWDD
jgi:hypothetical protein